MKRRNFLTALAGIIPGAAVAAKLPDIKRVNWKLAAQEMTYQRPADDPRPDERITVVTDILRHRTCYYDSDGTVIVSVDEEQIQNLGQTQFEHWLTHKIRKHFA